MLNKLLQGYVDKSYDELLEIARRCFGDLSVDLESLFEDESVSAMGIMLIIATCLGSDGKLTSLECNFLRDLLECDHDEKSIMAMVASFNNAKSYEMVDQLADSLPDSKKASLVSFCLCFLAVDETITRDEVAFVIKLMEP